MAGLIVRTIIGFTNVEDKIYPIFCGSCGKILGASFHNDASNHRTSSYCFNCIRDICRVAETIRNITKRDCLNNIPTVIEVEDVFLPRLISDKPSPLNLIADWCYEQYEKFTETEID